MELSDNINQLIAEIDEDAKKLFYLKNSKSYRYAWHSRVQTIKILKILLIHGNTHISSDLPDFPTSEQGTASLDMTQYANWVNLANFLIDLLQGDLEYHATLLDDEADDGGNAGFIYFAHKVKTTRQQKAIEEKLYDPYSFLLLNELVVNHIAIHTA